MTYTSACDTCLNKKGCKKRIIAVIFTFGVKAVNIFRSEPYGLNITCDYYKKQEDN